MMPPGFFKLIGRWFVTGSILFLVGNCFAETLVRLNDGVQKEAELLLAEGKVLIYTEKDCLACRKYIQRILHCKKSVRKMIHLVSTNTAAQTKEAIRRMPTEFPIYVLKNQKLAQGVYATPTTRFGNRQIIGIQTCGDVEKFVSFKGI